MFRFFSKWMLLFCSDRGLLVWKLIPMSVQRRGQQEGHQSHGFSQELMVAPSSVGQLCVAMQICASGISRPPNLHCSTGTITFFKIIKGYLPSETVVKLPSD